MEAATALSVGPPQVERVDAYRVVADTPVLALAAIEVGDPTGAPGAARRGLIAALREIVEARNEGLLLELEVNLLIAAFADPARAVDLCLRLQEAAEKHPPFRLGIGLDLGQVAARRDEHTVPEVFARHLGRARRIQQLAASGHVLTSHPVYDAAVGGSASEGIAWKAIGWTTLAGLAGPFSVHEPYRPGAQDPQPPLPEPDIEDLLELVTPSGARAPTGEPRELPPRQTRRVSEERQERPELFAYSVVEAPSKAGGEPDFDLFGVPQRHSGVESLEFHLARISRAAARLRHSPQRLLRRALVGQGAAPRILWVEDRPERIRSFREAFEASGCQVDQVEDTDAALRLGRRRRFDLVITSLVRGDDREAGVNLLRRRSEARVRCPAIVFAPPSEVAEERRAAHRAGAFECTCGGVGLVRVVAELLARAAYGSPTRSADTSGVLPFRA